MCLLFFCSDPPLPPKLCPILVGSAWNVIFWAKETRNNDDEKHAQAKFFRLWKNEHEKLLRKNVVPEELNYKGTENIFSIQKFFEKK